MAVIAPLRIARGVQTKVLETMTSARAVVCSHGAAQGILAKPGRHLLVADRPQDWVRQIERIMTDHSLRGEMGAAARQQMEQVHRWKSTSSRWPESSVSSTQT